jgi:hypothetical protein
MRDRNGQRDWELGVLGGRKNEAPWVPQPISDGSQAMRSMVASFVAMCSRAISAS